MLGDVLREDAHRIGRRLFARRDLLAPTTVAFVKLVNGSATYAFYDENTAGG